MALPGVTINILNGALGSVPSTNDAVAGLFVMRDAAAAIAFDADETIYSLEDLEGLGFSESVGADVYETVKQFYDAAGKGKELHIVQFDKVTDAANIAAKIKALHEASGNRIKILGVVCESESEEDFMTTANFTTHLQNINTALVSLTAEMKPVRAITGHYAGETPSLDLKTLSYNRVGVVASFAKVGDSYFSHVGLVLGRLAAIPVQRNIGRVRSGELPISNSWIPYATLETEINTLQSQMETWHAKGYIFTRTFVGKAGFYFNDDPTATASTDDYVSIARGRVIDKAMLLAYAVCLNEVNEEVPIQPDGTINAGFLKGLKANVENTINTAMTAEGEISSVRCDIDVTQNILATNKLTVSIAVIPVAYAKEIVVNLGFENPLNS